MTPLGSCVDRPLYGWVFKTSLVRPPLGPPRAPETSKAGAISDVLNALHPEATLSKQSMLLFGAKQKTNHQ